MLLRYEHPQFGPLKGVAQPLRFDGERCGQRHPPPMVGEHSVEILREAGCGEEQIDALLRQGVITRQGDLPLAAA